MRNRSEKNVQCVKKFECEKSGSKVSPDFWDNGSKPWPIVGTFVKICTFSEVTERSEDLLLKTRVRTPEGDPDITGRH